MRFKFLVRGPKISLDIQIYNTFGSDENEKKYYFGKITYKVDISIPLEDPWF